MGMPPSANSESDPSGRSHHTPENSYSIHEIVSSDSLRKEGSDLKMNGVQI